MSKQPRRSRTTRALTRAALVACAIVGVTGVLHTRVGRPLLLLVSGGQGGCPVALASPEKLEENRVASVKPLAGRIAAPSRAALTFTLGTTTRAEVSAFSRAHGVACKDDRVGTALRCTDVDPKVLSDGDVTIDDLFFSFDPGDRLVALDVMHRGTTGDDASRLLGDVSARLERVLGTPPTTTSGDRTSTYLTSAPYAQSDLAYRFSNLAVDVNATNFGDRGVVVREQYRAIPD